MQIQIPPALFTPQAPATAADAASDPLATARAGLLLPAGLDEDRVANVLGDVMGHAVDYSDAYFQLIREESWALEDGIVKDGAHSIELDPNTQYPVIALMPDQNGVEDIGGTLRLGSFPCVLDKTSKAYELYGEELIHERHRHRYEVNNDFRTVLTSHGMVLSGLSPDGRIVEMVELKDHPFFIATQAHPELKSRPNRPHPLFKGFVEAAVKAKK